ELNSSFQPPLLPSEVAKTVLNVWRWEERGHNVGPGSRGIVSVPGWFMDAIAGVKWAADAAFLYLQLQRDHWDDDDFPLSAEYYASKLGWTEPRLRRARATLESAGALERTALGGQALHDPARFAWAKPAGS